MKNLIERLSHLDEGEYRRSVRDAGYAGEAMVVGHPDLEKLAQKHAAALKKLDAAGRLEGRLEGSGIDDDIRYLKMIADDLKEIARKYIVYYG